MWLWLWLPKGKKLSCHCTHMICSNIKRQEKLLLHPRKGLSIKDMGVITCSVGSSSVLGVSSRSAAQHRRSCHSHRGVFVLLREPIQAAAQSWDSSPAPVLNEGSAVFPCPTRLPTLPVRPAHPTHSFLFLYFLKTKGDCPISSHYSPSSRFCLISILYSSFGASIKMFLFHIYILQMQTCSKLTPVAAAIRFFLD